MATLEERSAEVSCLLEIPGRVLLKNGFEVCENCFSSLEELAAKISEYSRLSLDILGFPPLFLHIESLLKVEEFEIAPLSMGFLS